MRDTYFPHRYPAHYPSNIQGNGVAGINNLNQAVEYTIGVQGYEVVREVYNALPYLERVLQNLGAINDIVGEIPYINNIAPLTDAIEKVSNHLDTIVGLSEDVPLLKEIYPRVQQFASDLKDIHSKLDKNDAHVDELKQQVTEAVFNISQMGYQYQKDLQQFIERADHQLCKLTEEYKHELECSMKGFQSFAKKIERFEPKFNEVVDSMSGIHVDIAHLKASDAVSLAVYSQCRPDKEKALRAIQVSEKYGTDESINRQRLGKGTNDADMLSILNRNEPDSLHADRTLVKGIRK